MKGLSTANLLDSRMVKKTVAVLVRPTVDLMAYLTAAVMVKWREK